MRCAEGLDSKHVASRSSQFSSQSQESTTVGHAVRLGDPDSGDQTRGTRPGGPQPGTVWYSTTNEMFVILGFWGRRRGHWIKLASLAL